MYGSAVVEVGAVLEEDVDYGGAGTIGCSLQHSSGRVDVSRVVVFLFWVCVWVRAEVGVCA